MSYFSECTFGILKGRWRILKTGVRTHTIKSVDNVWLTCCALHNWLLEIDGLDQPWDGVNAVTSEWTGEFGLLELSETPLALQRILSPAEIRDYDTSRVGSVIGVNNYGDNNTTDDVLNDADVVTAGDDVRCVRNLSLNYFRSKLVEHFEIMFNKNEIIWPMRRGVTPRIEGI